MSTDAFRISGHHSVEPAHLRESGPKRLAVIGTLVWDSIHHPARTDAEPLEQWGGIAYSLIALSAACPPGWVARPIIRLGADLAPDAFDFCRTLPNLEIGPGLTVVPEPNNRVELRYHEVAERTERLTGRVSGWTFSELEPLLDGVEAVYVNFVSGYEMDIDTAEKLRSLGIPLYADLHSLFLGTAPAEGPRPPRAPGDWRRWVAAFDAVQMNEAECRLLTAAAGESGRGVDDGQAPFLASLLSTGPRLVFVTQGERGASCVGAMSDGGPLVSRFPPATNPASSGDPTGCGDIWGAIMAISLAAGDPVEVAARRAGIAAAARCEVSRIEELRDAISESLDRVRGDPGRGDAGRVDPVRVDPVGVDPVRGRDPG